MGAAEARDTEDPRTRPAASAPVGRRNRKRRQAEIRRPRSRVMRRVHPPLRVTVSRREIASWGSGGYRRDAGRDSGTEMGLEFGNLKVGWGASCEAPSVGAEQDRRDRA